MPFRVAWRGLGNISSRAFDLNIETRKRRGISRDDSPDGIVSNEEAETGHASICG